MSSNFCSLALDVEEVCFEQQNEVPLSLLVNERFSTFKNELLNFEFASQDVVELGGTITVSF
ncbi:MAG: hypothetical protein H0T62_12040 [Parachlamydiaceae bacterium]|nr:hypothetical protein [Parachlamydiaceae bacterium]